MPEASADDSGLSTRRDSSEPTAQKIAEASTSSPPIGSMPLPPVPNISTTPMKPSTKPTKERPAGRGSPCHSQPMIATHNGSVAYKTAAKPDGTVSSPLTKVLLAKKNIRKPKMAAERHCAHVGFFAPLRHATV